MTGDIVRLIARLDRKPAVLVNGSAIGWYGLWQDQPLTESAKSHACFSHDLCEAWEQAARAAETSACAWSACASVLWSGRDGGFLSRMLTPFEFGLGGPLGSGRQWMSWIERDDLVRLIAHVIAKPRIWPGRSTPPRRFRSPTTRSPRSWRAGCIVPRYSAFPPRLLRRVGGDFAKELLLGGQRVLPNKALSNGFVFRHQSLRSALEAIL